MGITSRPALRPGFRGPAAQSAMQGARALALHPLRTALSALGVVIGVGSVIATLALADGLERYTRDQIAAETDVQAIVVGPPTEEIRDGDRAAPFPRFTPADAADLRRSLRAQPGSDGSVGSEAPVGAGAAAEVTMVAGGQTVVASALGPPRAAGVVGVLANYLGFGRKRVAAGRFFTDVETARDAPVAVVSHRLAAALSPTGDPAAVVERTVRLHGRPRTVVGVMAGYPGERGYQVFVPVRGVAGATAARAPVRPSLIVRAPSLEAVPRTQAGVEDWLAARDRDWPRRVSVTAAAARLEQARSGIRILKLTLGALAAISLVVGGVGIMNVLLASVAERTREIGVRKAMGARRRDVLVQFLAESVTVAGAGSGLGIALGYAAAFGVAALVRRQVPGARLYAAVTGGTLATAVASAVVVGLAFGTLPAVRAARLSPIDAIRHD